MLSKEELLKPRFELIAPYPGSTREVGSISTEVATAKYFRGYPANFREVHWTEYRKPEDMPEYVIASKIPDPDMAGTVSKLSDIQYYFWTFPHEFEPSTFEDYKQFTNPD